jgi:flavin-dependent dehydrogenase
VVIGAGPAGCAAAIALARAGIETVLLDRRTFPREKVCGDLIGARGVAIARRLGVPEETFAPYARLEGALILSGTSMLDLSARGISGRLALRGIDARVVPRVVFDHALLQAAQRAGASFTTLDVRNIGAWNGTCREIIGWHDGHRIALTARSVIVAGGYGCRLGQRSRSTSASYARGLALRAYLEGAKLSPNRLIFVLDPRLLPGYGWLFPLPDGRANVGVGTLLEDGRVPPLRALLEKLLAHPALQEAGGLQYGRLSGVPRAWPLDLGPPRSGVAGSGLLLAGEAIGLVGPLTGAGISFALASGEQAGTQLARALTRGDLTPRALARYARWLRAHFAPQLAVESAAQRLLADPVRLRLTLHLLAYLPGVPALGARLLLSLG